MRFKVYVCTRCVCIDDEATEKNKYYTRQHTVPEKYGHISESRKFWRHVRVQIQSVTRRRERASQVQEFRISTRLVSFRDTQRWPFIKAQKNVSTKKLFEDSGTQRNSWFQLRSLKKASVSKLSLRKAVWYWQSASTHFYRPVTSEPRWSNVLIYNFKQNDNFGLACFCFFGSSEWKDALNASTFVYRRAT